MKYFNKVIKYFAIVVVICSIGFVIWIFWLGANFHVDTYKDAESYVIIDNKMKSLEWKKQRIIDIFYEFQNTHSQYRLITTNMNDEKYHNFGGTVPYRSNLYRIYFYFSDIDVTVSCNVGVSTRNNATIMLYAISEGVNFADGWKRINNYKEISRKENRMIKKKFETEILDQLGVKWRHKRLWD